MREELNRIRIDDINEFEIKRGRWSGGSFVNSKGHYNMKVIIHPN